MPLTLPVRDNAPDPAPQTAPLTEQYTRGAIERAAAQWRQDAWVQQLARAAGLSPDRPHDLTALRQDAQAYGDALAQRAWPGARAVVTDATNTHLPTVTVTVVTPKGVPLTEPIVLAEVPESAGTGSRQVLLENKVIAASPGERPADYFNRAAEALGRFVEQRGQDFGTDAFRRGAKAAVTAGLEQSVAVSPLLNKQPWATARDLSTRVIARRFVDREDPVTRRVVTREQAFDPNIAEDFLGRTPTGEVVEGYARRSNPTHPDAGESIASQFQSGYGAGAPGMVEVAPGVYSTTLAESDKPHKRLQGLEARERVFPEGEVVYRSPFARLVHDPETGEWRRIAGGQGVKVNRLYAPDLPAGQGWTRRDRFVKAGGGHVDVPPGGELVSHVERGESGWVERDLQGNVLRDIGPELERNEHGLIIGLYRSESGTYPLTFPERDAEALKDFRVSPSTVGRPGLRVDAGRVLTASGGQVKLDSAHKSVLARLAGRLPYDLPAETAARVDEVAMFPKGEYLSAVAEQWAWRQIVAAQEAGAQGEGAPRRFDTPEYRALRAHFQEGDVFGGGSQALAAIDRYLAGETGEILLNPGGSDRISRELTQAYLNAHRGAIRTTAVDDPRIHWSVRQTLDEAFPARDARGRPLVPTMFDETMASYTDTHGSPRPHLREDPFTIGVAASMGRITLDEARRRVAHPAARPYQHVLSVVGLNRGRETNLTPVDLDMVAVRAELAKAGLEETPENVFRAMAGMETYGWNPVNLKLLREGGLTDYAAPSAGAMLHFLGTNQAGQVSGLAQRLYNLFAAYGAGGNPTGAAAGFDQALDAMARGPEFRHNLWGASEGVMTTAVASRNLAPNRMGMGAEMIARLFGRDVDPRTLSRMAVVEPTRYPFSSAKHHLGTRLGVTARGLEVEARGVAAVNPLVAPMWNEDFDGELQRVQRLAEAEGLPREDAVLWAVADRLRSLGGDVGGTPARDVDIGTPGAPNRQGVMNVILRMRSPYNEAHKWVEDMRAHSDPDAVYAALREAALPFVEGRARMTREGLAGAYVGGLRAQVRMQLFNRVNREGEMVFRPEERELFTWFEDIMYQRAQDSDALPESLSKYLDLAGSMRYVGRKGDFTLGYTRRLGSEPYREDAYGYLEPPAGSYLRGGKSERLGTFVRDVVAMLFGEDSAFATKGVDERLRQLTGDAATREALAALHDPDDPAGSVERMAGALLPTAGGAQDWPRFAELMAGERAGGAFRLVHHGAFLRSFRGAENPSDVAVRLTQMFGGTPMDMMQQRDEFQWLSLLGRAMGGFHEVPPEQLLDIIQAGRKLGGGFRPLFRVLGERLGMKKPGSLPVPQYYLPELKDARFGGLTTNGAGERLVRVLPHEEDLLKRIRNNPLEAKMLARQGPATNLDLITGESVPGQGNVAGYWTPKPSNDVRGSIVGHGLAEAVYSKIRAYYDDRLGLDPDAERPEYTLDDAGMAMGSLVHALYGGAKDGSRPALVRKTQAAVERHLRSTLFRDRTVKFFREAELAFKMPHTLTTGEQAGTEIQIGGTPDLVALSWDGNRLGVDVFDPKLSQARDFYKGSAQVPFYMHKLPQSPEFQAAARVFLREQGVAIGDEDPLPLGEVRGRYVVAGPHKTRLHNTFTEAFGGGKSLYERLFTDPATGTILDGPQRDRAIARVLADPGESERQLRALASQAAAMMADSNTYVVPDDLSEGALNAKIDAAYYAEREAPGVISAARSHFEGSWDKLGAWLKTMFTSGARYPQRIADTQKALAELGRMGALPTNGARGGVRYESGVNFPKGNGNNGAPPKDPPGAGFAMPDDDPRPNRHIGPLRGMLDAFLGGVNDMAGATAHLARRLPSLPEGALDRMASTRIGTKDGESLLESYVRSYVGLANAQTPDEVKASMLRSDVIFPDLAWDGWHGLKSIRSGPGERFQGGKANAGFFGKAISRLHELYNAETDSARMGTIAGLIQQAMPVYQSLTLGEFGTEARPRLGGPNGGGGGGRRGGRGPEPTPMHPEAMGLYDEAAALYGHFRDMAEQYADPTTPDEQAAFKYARQGLRGTRGVMRSMRAIGDQGGVLGFAAGTAIDEGRATLDALTAPQFHRAGGGAGGGRRGAEPPAPMTFDQASTAADALTKLNATLKETGKVAQETEGWWGKVFGVKDAKLEALGQQAQGYSRAYTRLGQIEGHVQRRGLVGGEAEAYRGREQTQAEVEIRDADRARPQTRARLFGDRLLFNAYDLWYAGLIGRQTWDPFSQMGQEATQHRMGTMQALAGFGVAGEAPAFVGARHRTAQTRESLGTQAAAMESVLTGTAGVLDGPLGVAAMIGLPAIGAAGLGQHVLKSILGIQGASALGLLPITAGVMTGMFLGGASKNKEALADFTRYLTGTGEFGFGSVTGQLGLGTRAWASLATSETWDDITAEMAQYEAAGREAQGIGERGFRAEDVRRASPVAGAQALKDLARSKAMAGPLAYMEEADRERLAGKLSWMYTGERLDQVNWAQAARQEMAGIDIPDTTLRLLQAQGQGVSPGSLEFALARDRAFSVGTAENVTLQLYGAQAGAVQITADRAGITAPMMSPAQFGMLSGAGQQGVEFTQGLIDRVARWSGDTGRYWEMVSPTREGGGPARDAYLRPRIFKPGEEGAEAAIVGAAESYAQRVALRGGDYGAAMDQVLSRKKTPLAAQFEMGFASMAEGVGQGAFNITGNGAFAEAMTDAFSTASPEVRAQMQGVLSGDQQALSMWGTRTGQWDLVTREANTGQRMYSTAASWGGPIQYLSPFAQSTLWQLTSRPTLANVLRGDVATGQLGNLTGITGALGGTVGLQQYMSDLSYMGQMASAGSSMRQLRLDSAFTTGVGLGAYGNTILGQDLDTFGATSLAEPGGYWGLQDRMRDLGRQQARAGLGIQGQQLALGAKHFMENWNFNRDQAVLQRGWQEQDFGFQAMQMAQGRTWQREDWAFNEGQRALQYGRGLEDIDESIRFATGRERKLMARQRGRLTEDFNIAEGRDDTVRGRQEKLWKDEDERFGTQIKRAQELFDLQMERFDMEKRQFEERQGLQQAYQDTQLGFLTEREALEDQLQDLQRTQWKLQKEEQERAIGAQAGIATKMKEAQDLMTKIANEQVRVESAMRVKQQTEVEYYKQSALLLWRIASQFNKDTPYPTFAWETAPAEQYESRRDAGPTPHWGFSGLVTAPTMVPVAENGAPEWVTVTPINAMAPASRPSSPAPESAGAVYVTVYLDNKQIAAAQEVRRGRDLHLASRR